MFFSIIIPTYNPRKYIIPLLDSIATNKCIDDMEVIISDDCSTESFDDILEKYPTLNFKVITNEEHFGWPSKGRANGLKIAQGKWICFADQDDYFEDKSLDTIKEGIETSRAKNYLITDIILNFVNDYNKVIGSAQMEWTHGKVYERAFLTRNRIEYSDLKYSEDVDFSIKMACALLKEKKRAFQAGVIFYTWCRRDDSLCNHDYHLHMMPDYIQATLKTIMEYMIKYKKDNNLYNDYKNLFLKYLLTIYFYLQGSQFLENPDKADEAIKLIRPFYQQFISILKEHNEDTFTLLTTDLLLAYEETRTFCFTQRPFIERVTLENFLNNCLN